MSILEKIVGLFTPQFTVGEADPRERMRRSYDAAKRTRTNSDWIDSRLDANREMRDALSIVRSGSRDAERNNGLYRRMLAMHVAYIVGRGFQLQSLPRNPDRKVDQIASNIIEGRWRQWARKPVTIDGRLNFAGLCKLAVLSWIRDGEMFVRPLLRGGELKFQPIEGDYVPETFDDYYTPNELRATGGNRTVNGIVVDDDGARVAYHIAKEHPGAYGYGRSTRPDTVLIDAADVLHLYKPERTGQVRGMPLGAASFDDLRMLKGYFSAELAAARANAARPVSIERTADATGEFTGDTESPEGEIEFDGAPGGATLLPFGHKVNWSPVTHPSGTFDSYTNAVTRQLASTWGVSHALLTRNLSEVNYSSLRIESVDCARYFSELQDHFVLSFLQPIFERWLETELLALRLSSGRIVLPYSNRSKYEEVRFIPPPFPSLDPMKDLEAEEKKVQLGIKSLQDVCLEQTGEELADVLDKRVEERELLKEKGLPDVSPESANGREVLNGAQVESMVLLLSNVASGVLPKPSAIVALVNAFGFETDVATAIVAPIQVGTLSPAETQPDAPYNKNSAPPKKGKPKKVPTE